MTDSNLMSDKGLNEEIDIIYVDGQVNLTPKFIKLKNGNP